MKNGQTYTYLVSVKIAVLFIHPFYSVCITTKKTLASTTVRSHLSRILPCLMHLAVPHPCGTKMQGFDDCGAEVLESWFFIDLKNTVVSNK